MIRVDRKSGPPSSAARRWNDFLLQQRQRLTRYFEIIDGDSRFKLRCATPRELGRCYKFFLKEPGTCDWINKDVAANEVFYDIGANIGVFTLLAASRTGAGGKVYAFEPHSANFTRLLDNIALNNLQHIIIPCNFALNDQDGFFPFNYLSNEAGTSDSQLSTLHNVAEVEYKPEVSELKYAISIDSLITSGKFPAPRHIKIDVDGNELLILHGMSNLLNSPERPQSIQVEINKRYKDELMPFMDAHSYQISHKHYTRGIQKRIDKGANPEDHHYNAIFRPI